MVSEADTLAITPADYEAPYFAELPPCRFAFMPNAISD
jgi:hypothetical protein